jgi:ketosteroid isomerase-like protein
MPPRGVVAEWVEAFNGEDADRLASFYSDDAVNHQMPEEPVAGEKGNSRLCLHRRSRRR